MVRTRSTLAHEKVLEATLVLFERGIDATSMDAIAEKSGGRLLRADKLDSLPAAFANIAAELRTQYLLGYYPTNAAHDGRYRKIKVSTSRKNIVVRARPGYSARNG